MGVSFFLFFLFVLAFLFLSMIDSLGVTLHLPPIVCATMGWLFPCGKSILKVRVGGGTALGALHPGWTLLLCSPFGRRWVPPLLWVAGLGERLAVGRMPLWESLTPPASAGLRWWTVSALVDQNQT